MFAIAKTFEFASSHRLAREDWSDEKNHEVYGKCSNPHGHGHNYKLEVVVSGELNQETGMVFDASLLDSIVQEHVFQDVDHKHLNTDVPWLKGKVPTAEVIVNAIWEQLEKPIKNAVSTAQLEKLVLHETSRIYATRSRN